MRPSQRQPHELRPVSIERQYTRHAEGSVLIRMGDTHVLCTASVEESVPGFLRGKGNGHEGAEKRGKKNWSGHDDTHWLKLQSFQTVCRNRDGCVSLRRNKLLLRLLPSVV